MMNKIVSLLLVAGVLVVVSGGAALAGITPVVRVPEPGTLSLLAAAAAGYAAYRRLRGKK